MSGTEIEELARLRAEKIIRVQSGQMSAMEAARQLGVSRKTYYKWEKRLLSRMVEVLSEREAGRPGKIVDEEKEALKNQIEELKKEVLVLQQTLRIREVLEVSGKAKQHQKRQHSAQASSQATDEKGGGAGQGAKGNRDACAKIDGVLPVEEASNTGKRENDGTEGQAAETPASEYGLEKKRARQEV